MFVIMAVMLTAGTVTAFADYDDNAGYDENTDYLCEVEEAILCADDEQDVDVHDECDYSYDDGYVDEYDLQ